MKNSTYKKILGKIPAGVFVFGEDLRILYANASFARAFAAPGYAKKAGESIKAALFSTRIFPAPFAPEAAKKNNRSAEKRRSAVIARCTA